MNGYAGVAPHHSIPAWVDHWAEIQPDSPFLTDPDTGKTLTCLELKHSCLALAHRLRKTGHKQGDRIAYAMGNSGDTARVILGIMYGGFVATAVNLISGRNVIAHVINHSGTRTVFVDSASESEITRIAGKENPDVHVEKVGAELFTDRHNGTLTLPTPALDALLMYTSGTTGLPKGVVHTHRSLIAGGSNCVVAHKLGSDDCGLCVLPLHHINGLCVTLLGNLVCGGRLVMPHRFSASKFWQHVIARQCSWFSVVPTQISYLLNETGQEPGFAGKLSSVRFGRSASAPLAPDVQKAFEARFNIPIIETMGLTETAAQILSNPIDGPRKPGSPGIAFGNEVMVADSAFQECRRGEEGELLVRGPNVMREYRSNPDATSSALTDDGWLRTGDLGRMDEDGYVFVTGRLKEIIIKGGENIAPREVDEALYSHPDVIEAAAFARACPQYGQRVEAGVRLRDGSALQAEELIRICRDRIGAFKTPDRIYIMSRLPKGPSGKVQRMKLAELVS